MKEIRIGLIGFGAIGKLHTLAYRSLPLSVKNPRVKPHLVALLRSQLSSGAEQAEASGFELVTTSAESFYARQLDAVDICSPNQHHLEQASQALKAGTAVYCEKPLGLNYSQAAALAKLAEESEMITQVAFTNRYSPGIRQIKQLLSAGLIGRILHFRGKKFRSSYLDTGKPMSWRLRFSESGGGAFQDLGSHMADLVCYLFGDVTRVRADMRTFISDRPAAQGSSQYEKVDVDDWARCQIDLPGEASGTIEVSRMAAGSIEATGLEIYGEYGSLVYSSNNPETSVYYDLKQKQWQTSEMMAPATPGERPISELWPDKKLSQGDMLNRHMAEIHDFLLNVAEHKMSTVDFRAGAKAQEIVEAAYLSAAQDGDWQILPLM